MNTLELDDDSLRLLINSVEMNLDYAESSLDTGPMLRPGDHRLHLLLRREITDLTRLLTVLKQQLHFGSK